MKCYDDQQRTTRGPNHHKPLTFAATQQKDSFSQQQQLAPDAQDAPLLPNLQDPMRCMLGALVHNYCLVKATPLCTRRTLQPLCHGVPWYTTLPSLCPTRCINIVYPCMLVSGLRATPQLDQYHPTRPRAAGYRGGGYKPNWSSSSSS